MTIKYRCEAVLDFYGDPMPITDAKKIIKKRQKGKDINCDDCANCPALYIVKDKSNEPKK